MHKGQDQVNILEVYHVIEIFVLSNFEWPLKEARSVTLNIFRKKSFLFKSFVKIELIYVFTINMFSIAESCTEQ